MGQKNNPEYYRSNLAKSRNALSYERFGTPQFKEYIKQGILSVNLLKNLKKTKNPLSSFLLGSIEYEKVGNKLRLIISSDRRNVTIAKDNIDFLQNSLFKVLNHKPIVYVKEIKNSNTYADFVCSSICSKISERASIKATVATFLDDSKMKVAGIKIKVAGRLNGVEMARTQTFAKGSMPLHTIRADIDYTSSFAMTQYGIIGVKVWIYIKDNSQLCSSQKK